MAHNGAGRSAPARRSVSKLPPALAAWLAVAAPAYARAASPDALCRVTSWASPRQLAAGASAEVFFLLQPRAGAQLAARAPLRVSLSARNLSLTKTELTQTDAVVRDGGTRLVVQVRAGQPGLATLHARLLFYVCTRSACTRQTRQIELSLPVRRAGQPLAGCPPGGAHHLGTATPFDARRRQRGAVSWRMHRRSKGASRVLPGMPSAFRLALGAQPFAHLLLYSESLY